MFLVFCVGMDAERSRKPAQGLLMKPVWIRAGAQGGRRREETRQQLAHSAALTGGSQRLLTASSLSMSDSWTVLSNFSLPERSMLRRSRRYAPIIPHPLISPTACFPSPSSTSSCPLSGSSNTSAEFSFGWMSSSLGSHAWDAGCQAISVSSRLLSQRHGSSSSCRVSPAGSL